MDNAVLRKLQLPKELSDILNNGRVKITMPESRQDLLYLAMGRSDADVFEIAYPVPGHGVVAEATVTRCKNGVAVNYTDMYMRRRDPDCMVVADEGLTDKARYEDRYGKTFEPLRADTFTWLNEQEELLVMPFMSGGPELGYPSLLVAPINAGFFAGGLADLQGMIPMSQVPDNFKPKAIIYLAPPFRHTHFDGKQIVVHNRLEGMHELFSYNLYPGPSAKKGIYGVLLTIGESEGWVTLHGSTVRIVSPYENVFTIMHEGASGGGKSEMIEPAHREPNGKLLLGQNTITKEKIYVDIADSSDLLPVTDDMALCHPAIQNDSKKLVVTDAEAGWFVRVNHITHYATDPHLEKLTIHPKEPLIFLNMDGAPNSTCLIWEHTMDEPGKPCPNPRVILPRKFVPDTVNEPVEVDLRSFGVRTPPSTSENPNYGIMGLFHVLSPALGWLWRLAAPRGHANPSIVTTEGMSSEGVGSYWPFATGRMVDQANLLLEQILNTPNTRFILIPNQHIGAYKVGFAPQWITREYLSRKGNVKFRPEQLTPARCSLLGYALDTMKVDGTVIPKGFLRVENQPEVGKAGYDQGAQILDKFFKKELRKYLSPDLNPLGRQIIEACLADCAVEEYEKFIPMK